MEPELTITHLLEQWGGGDKDALGRLTPLVYDQLHRIAARQMNREDSDHTLSPTAVVHEAYLRLQDYGMNIRDRNHFLAIASTEMRRVLVDHARRRGSQKRGEGWHRVTFADDDAVEGRGPADILAVQEAMEKLAAVDPRKAQLVDLIVFGGLTAAEAAETMGISVATVNRDWKMARAFLQSELKPAG